MFTYNWSSYSYVEQFLIDLFNNSKQDTEIEYVREFISDVEEYLWHLKASRYDFNKIMEKLGSISKIGFYNNKCVPGKSPVVNLGNEIYLNREIGDTRKLSARERRRLYLFKALTKRVFNFRTETTMAFSTLYSSYISDAKERKAIEGLVNLGWEALEDTLAQEYAEERIFELSQTKARDIVKEGLEGEDYPIHGENVKSRMEDFRVFDRILHRFGCIIVDTGNSRENSKGIAFERMINGAFKGSLGLVPSDYAGISSTYGFDLEPLECVSLSDEIINYYFLMGYSVELYKVLYLTGILANEKYRRYGLPCLDGITVYPELADSVLGNIIYLLNRLYKEKRMQQDSSEEGETSSRIDDTLPLRQHEVKARLRTYFDKNSIV